MTGQTAKLDHRLGAYLERQFAFPIHSLPAKGVEVRGSAERTGASDNRLRIARIGDCAFGTVALDVAAAVLPVIQSMTVHELFSPLGLAELRRAMRPEEGESLAHCFGYLLADERDLRPADTPHEAAPLRKQHIPSHQLDLRMSQRRPPAEAQQQDFVWAFACHHREPDAAADELAKFGPRCTSVAVLIWKTPDLAEFGVETEKAHRGRGYARAAVSAAARFVLRQGAVAVYGAHTTNIPSLRIARRLGFRFGWESIWA